MTGSESDAEEIVQETFLRAYQAAEVLRSPLKRGHLALSNCRDGSIDLLRKRKRHDAHLEPLDSEETFAPALSSPPRTHLRPDRLYSAQLSKRVADVLEQLSSVEKAAFVLRHYEELSDQEIAQSLGLSSSAENRPLSGCSEDAQGSETMGEVEAMRHPTEEQLVLHYYGELENPLEAVKHLEKLAKLAVYVLPHWTAICP